MSQKKVGKSFLARLSLALIGIAALWLLVAWLTSAPASRASGELRRLTFQSPILPIGDPQLRLVKTVDNDAPAANEEIEYTLTYSTTQPGSEAFNVQLYDFLPAGAQFVSAHPSASHQNGMVTFNVDSVGEINQTATVRVRVREGYRELFNHALVMADLVPPAHASLSTSVEQPSPRLSLTKLGPSAVLTDTELVYTLHCENTSDEPAHDVTVVDVLPTGVGLAAASPPPEAATPPVVSWALGDLAPGDRRTIVITTTSPASAGTITNTALADAPQWVIEPQTWATQVVEEGAILQVTKRASAPIAEINEQLVYTLRYKNVGNLTANGVILADTLPAGVTVTGVSPSPTSQTSQLITWDLVTLDPGESGQAVITLTVGGVESYMLHNEADVTGTGSFPGHAELDTPVQPKALYLPLMLRNAQ